MRKFIAVLCFVSTPLAASQAAGPPDAWKRMQDSKEQITAYLVGEARRVTDAASAEVVSEETWERVRERRRREFLDSFGLDPLPRRTPLNARITGTLVRDEYTIEKIAFESMPRVYVTGNLYIPKGRDRPLPTVVYVCGHDQSPYGNKVMNQRHPITLARNGYVCLILDSIQVAEVFSLHHGVKNFEMYDWYARGYNPSAVEVWNVSRALDYLETRPEVDRTRFGITGRSGGANTSWFSSVADPRIKVVVPVMGIGTYAANVAYNTQRSHCDCVFPINTYLQDLTTIGALIWPRPLCMMHGRKDGLFPVAGYEEFEAKVGLLYASCGSSDRFKNVVVDTAHADSEYLREQAVKWFDRWLKGEPNRQIRLDYTDEPGENLAVFGGNPPPDAENYRVHEILIPDPKPATYASADAWAKRRSELIALLRQKVFGAFPREAGAVEARGGALAAPSGMRSLELETEPGIGIQAVYQPVPRQTGPGLLYVASDTEDLRAILDTLGQLPGKRSNPVLVVYPRGVGEVPWDKSFWKATLRNSMQLGRTIDSMRVWDVLQAARWFRRETQDRPIATLGIGVSGVLGLYAGVLDERIDQVMLIHPPVSHHDGPIFLNVLRFTDLPEAAAILAPRHLTFVGRMPDAFEVTRRIYALSGAGDQIGLTMSVEYALNGRFGHGFPGYRPPPTADP